LVVHNGYDRPTTETSDFAFDLKKGMVVTMVGKYCNREELAPCYDIRCGLYDNPKRTTAKFEMRTRSLSPTTADNQMRFYDVGLVSSFRVYAERTKDAVDPIIDLGGEDRELVYPAKLEGSVWGSLCSCRRETHVSNACVRLLMYRPIESEERPRPRARALPEAFWHARSLLKRTDLGASDDPDV
jgi:hypothetical protein